MLQYKNGKEKTRNSEILRKLKKFSFGLSLFAIIVIIFDVGFSHEESTNNILSNFYPFILFVGILTILIRYFYSTQTFSFKVRFFDGIVFVLFLLLLLVRIDGLGENSDVLLFFNKMGWVYLAIFFYFFRELLSLKLNFSKDYLNPAQLFIVSFLLIILIGTFLLMLPKATYGGISLIDALFTSTSAVCVTGLIVVDTGSFFTPFGQTIILILIQLGGLGIMTFASYFSYFFRGQSSYETQLMMKDFTNSDKIGEVFSVLKKILILTFTIEFFGAFFIYFSLDPLLFSGSVDRVFFSIFHSISAFCNAGFSTLANGLYEPEFSFNYPLQLVIAGMFILGGIGFPILLNLFKYASYLLGKKILKFKSEGEPMHLPWVLNLNTRIILITSLILTLVGTLLFYILEYDNVLAPHGAIGKIVTAFFGAATPRTAGFNSIDTSALNFSTIMIIFLLMWIGASPGSTGGGIKTSTFAIMTLNFFSLARGKDRIEVYRREIADVSVRRAFAIVSLSLMVIGTAVVLIAKFDEEKTLLSIAFESFSAYSTVGLSLGITAALTLESKLVIIATMFIGRVSMLTILIAVLRRVKHLNYKYPSEEILIN